MNEKKVHSFLILTITFNPMENKVHIVDRSFIFDIDHDLQPNVKQGAYCRQIIHF